MDALYSSKSIRLFDRCPSASVEVFAQAAYDNLAMEDYQYDTLRRALDVFTNTIDEYKHFMVVYLRDKTNMVSIQNTLSRYAEDESGYSTYDEESPVERLIDSFVVAESVNPERLAQEAEERRQLANRNQIESHQKAQKYFESCARQFEVGERVMLERGDR
ncbi:Hypothetical predicted protein [Olea europaea subsp. europaea]|uniref:Deoxynucleoside kinase domain-containing protein n=1 Tax=Olea europaea subsp. europaea TaxID=158383 RepID=A0A8S0REP3_OLEEU|nr:Hypothetical predicted protein [Olea europaea subsp. europaea]